MFVVFKIQIFRTERLNDNSIIPSQELKIFEEFTKVNSSQAESHVVAHYQLYVIVAY